MRNPLFDTVNRGVVSVIVRHTAERVALGKGMGFKLRDRVKVATGGNHIHHRWDAFEVFVEVGVDFLQLGVDSGSGAVEDEIGPVWVGLCSEG